MKDETVAERYCFGFVFSNECMFRGQRGLAGVEVYNSRTGWKVEVVKRDDCERHHSLV